MNFFDCVNNTQENLSRKDRLAFDAMRDIQMLDNEPDITSMERSLELILRYDLVRFDGGFVYGNSLYYVTSDLSVYRYEAGHSLVLVCRIMKPYDYFIYASKKMRIPLYFKRMYKIEKCGDVTTCETVPQVRPYSLTVLFRDRVVSDGKVIGVI